MSHEIGHEKKRRKPRRLDLLTMTKLMRWLEQNADPLTGKALREMARRASSALETEISHSSISYALETLKADGRKGPETNSTPSASARITELETRCKRLEDAIRFVVTNCMADHGGHFLEQILSGNPPAMFEYDPALNENAFGDGARHEADHT